MTTFKNVYLRLSFRKADQTFLESIPNTWKMYLIFYKIDHKLNHCKVQLYYELYQEKISYCYFRQISFKFTFLILIIKRIFKLALRHKTTNMVPQTVYYIWRNDSCRKFRALLCSSNLCVMYFHHDWIQIENDTKIYDCNI